MPLAPSPQPVSKILVGRTPWSARVPLDPLLHSRRGVVLNTFGKTK
jgi:hypothetical protein